jgi:Root hair defective 3 GTP-binding protein (RHD3)
MVEVAEIIKLASHSLRLCFLTVVPQTFERKSALFALACSRVVIVNMWEIQVGLHNGANMGLLRIVFEEHLSLYGNLDKQYAEFVLLLVPDLMFNINKSFHQLISVAKSHFPYSSSQ